MTVPFKLPALGENIETGEVVQLLVAPGDTVAADQPLLELETDKATIEVPSPAAGTIASIAVSAGDTVKVGQLILTLGDTDDGPTSTPLTTPAEVSAAPAPASATPETVPVMADPAPVPDARATRTVLASPSVRRLARELGVDLADVTGSGAKGRVLTDDVKTYTRQELERPPASGDIPSTGPTLADFSKWGSVDRAPLRGVRHATMRQVTESWRTVPHVTQHDRADTTQFEEVRKQLKTESPDVPLTVTAFAVHVVARALKKFPKFNASLDVAREEIVYKQYVNIGIAVDTDRGLLVPVIRGADQKSLLEISNEIVEIAENARAKRVSVEDLRGGTFTVTNLGGIGGTAFSPIVNHPEVAILGLSRAAHAPVWVDERFEPRLMLPLSLSYDHRLIDGADAIRFLRWVVDRLEQPLLLSLGSI